MALCSQHIFQVLTKRPERMRAYLASGDLRMRIWEAGEALAVAGAFDPDKRDLRNLQFDMGIWPLPNVWIGTSVEDQRRADERIPGLLATPAAVRFISAEPLLGPIELLDADPYAFGTARTRVPKRRPDIHPPITEQSTFREVIEALGGRSEVVDRGVGWVIVGGESGHGARPMHPDWARSLRDQCAAAGVPYFFKQWGEHYPVGHVDRGSATDPIEFAWERVGKKAAGRLLDGVEHNGMPEGRP